MLKVKLDYSYEVSCVRHQADTGASCFSADVIIRDADGKEVTRVLGKRLHSYVEAAEDEAIDACTTFHDRTSSG
jgi:hypothetical protein